MYSILIDIQLSILVIYFSYKLWKGSQKKYLISYEMGITRFFGDGDWEQNCELTIRVVNKSIFGQRTREYKSNYTASMFQGESELLRHWDTLIKNATPL